MFLSVTGSYFYSKSTTLRSQKNNLYSQKSAVSIKNGEYLQ